MKSKLIQTIILCILPLWWIFQILWMPGYMHALADFSYRFEPVPFSTATLTSARNRAYEYATRGGTASEDIYFSALEVSHLDDVSRLYKPIEIVLNTFAVIAWSVLFLAVYKKANFDIALRLASKLLALFVGVMFLCLLVFNIFFEKFHKLLFPQGNWAFPADSLLITLFPETFWKLELLSIVVFLNLFVLLYWVLGKRYYEGVHSK